MNSLLQAIEGSWGWAIGKPVSIVALNAFGNVIVRNDAGKFFRIMPEGLKCAELAEDEAELKQKFESAEFQQSWEMNSLVQSAHRTLGGLSEGQCYHLVIPSVIGGVYEVKNLKIISTREWLELSGYVAQQIRERARIPVEYVH